MIIILITEYYNILVATYISLVIINTFCETILVF